MLNCMNQQEKTLIASLMANRITKEELIQRYPFPLTDEYIHHLVRSAVNQKDGDSLGFAMVLVYTKEVFSTALLPILEPILVEGWHQSHEDIAFLLQKLKSPTSAKWLFRAATMTFDYLEYDEFFALARKCMWALAAINTAESVAMIQQLATSDNEVVREHAEEQLERLGKA